MFYYCSLKHNTSGCMILRVCRLIKLIVMVIGTYSANQDRAFGGPTKFNGMLSNLAMVIVKS